MFGDGVAGIGRDLGELAASGPLGWLIIALVASIPVLGIILVLARSRLAWVSLGIFLLVVLGSFLYYATGWLENPGLSGAVPTAAALMIAWLLLFVAAWRVGRHRRPGRHPSRTTR